ncbi:MAG: ABC transporter substrate-binding protein, partial [Burkholderiales bacterium]
MSRHMNAKKLGNWLETLKLSRRDFILAPLATGALALTPRFAGAQAGLPYRIGLLLSSSGTGVNYMSHAIRGLPLLAKEINDRGGLLGRHPIHLVYRDDATRPETGAREAAGLILNDRVNAIFGTYSSGVALAVQEVIHEHKTLHFVATANSS